MKYLGYALIVWGIADFGLSYAGTDVWADWFGIQLPEAIWRFSGMIAIALGYGALKLGGYDAPKGDPEEEIEG